MKLYLRKDWDYPPSFDTKVTGGIFAGRKKEKDQLVNEFLRKNRGSILVSGVRGVGKTSVVYQALKDAQGEDPSIVPVVLNATQLELHLRDPEKLYTELPEKVLKNLIRRLYSSLEEENYNNSNLQDLYKKAVASEFISREELASKDTESESEVISDSDARKLTWQIDRSWASRLIGSVVLFLPPIFSELVNKILAVGLILIPEFSSSSTITSLKETLQKYFKSTSTSAQKIYQIDNSLGNLEYDLNSVLKQLQGKKKVIFVIDELDKVEKPSSDKSSEDPVQVIIKIYKNLFNLSPAIFVFITDELTFRRVVDAREPRGKEYTLFSSRLFINRPDFGDVKEFIEEIVEEIELDYGKKSDRRDREFSAHLSKESNYQDFINHLCFKAETEFFEVYNLLRDYITEFDDKRRPVINIPQLSQEDLLKARIQEMISSVYERNKFNFQSDRHKNDKISDFVYWFVNTNFRKEFKADFNNKMKSKDEADGTVAEKQDGCIRDLLDWLLGIGVLQEINRITQDAEGNPTDIREFQWTGKVPVNVPLFEEPFEQEREFLETLAIYAQLVNQIDDIVKTAKGEQIETYDPKIVHDIYNSGVQSESGIDVLAVYKKFEPPRLQLEKKLPKHISDDDMKKSLDELGQEIKKLRDNGRIIFENAVKDLCEEKSYPTQIKQLTEDGTLLSSIPELRDKVISEGLQHAIIHRTDNSKQIVTTLDIPPELITDGIKQLLEQNQDNCKLVNIQTKKGVDYSGAFRVQKKKGEGFRKTKLLGFKNIDISENFRSMAPAVRKVTDWLA